MYSLQVNLFCSTIRVVFDAKTPLRRRQSLLQYTFRPQNASNKAEFGFLKPLRPSIKLLVLCKLRIAVNTELWWMYEDDSLICHNISDSL